MKTGVCKGKEINFKKIIKGVGISQNQFCNLIIVFQLNTQNDLWLGGGLKEKKKCYGEDSNQFYCSIKLPQM